MGIGVAVTQLLQQQVGGVVVALAQRKVDPLADLTTGRIFGRNAVDLLHGGLHDLAGEVGLLVQHVVGDAQGGGGLRVVEPRIEAQPDDARRQLVQVLEAPQPPQPTLPVQVDLPAADGAAPPGSRVQDVV